MKKDDPFQLTINKTGQVERPSGSFRAELVNLLDKHHIDLRTDLPTEEVAEFILATLRLLLPDEMGQRRLTGDLKVIIPPAALNNEQELIRRLLDALGSPMDSPVSYLQIDTKRQEAFSYAEASGWKKTGMGWRAPGKLESGVRKLLNRFRKPTP